MAVTGMLDRLLHWLLPAPCLACGEPLGSEVDPWGLCTVCRHRLSPAAIAGAGACARCARPLEAAAAPEGYLCGACRSHPPSYDRLLAGWSYQPPLDAVIRGLKFRRLDYLGGHLGASLADRLEAEIARETAAGAAVVPMPLHWRRRLGRGYNQAELIARPVARRFRLPWFRGLRRRRATPPQSSLERQRRSANLRGSFHCRRPPPEGTLLLVDDVTTTGATLEAAAACLKAAGAGRVVGLVVARTPLAAEMAAWKR